jgi:DNA-binding LacI/PurR family transcriptional regulator
MAGYRQALTEAGIPFDPRLVVAGSGRTGGGARALPLLMTLDEPPTAVFCYNDLTATGLLHAAREEGVEVPQELAVVGFDDILLASYVYPPLTSVAQPKAEMGRQALQMALTLMTAEDPTAEGFSNIVLRGQLVVRESSGGVKK